MHVSWLQQRSGVQLRSGSGCDDGSCVDDGFVDCIDPKPATSIQTPSARTGRVNTLTSVVSVVARERWVATTRWRRITTRPPHATTGHALCTGVLWIWHATMSRRRMWTTIRASLGRVRGAMIPMTLGTTRRAPTTVCAGRLRTSRIAVQRVGLDRRNCSAMQSTALGLW